MSKRSILSIGSRVLNGKYEVLKVIHSSGMSNVYLVMDSSLNKQWCLKEIKKSEAGYNDIEYRSLLQEANIMKDLNHPNIPRIVTIEEEGDSVFIVMDYVDGVSLKSYISKFGIVEPELAISWVSQVAGVLAYLHNRKEPIFYRDMKPDNIMIQNDGNIRLLDFGISIVIKEKGQKIKENLGTKGYASPEQYNIGSVCDLRSDIYSLGMTMYTMLTGINPSKVPIDKLEKIENLVPGLSTGISYIVNKCISINPDERYQSCEELLYDLKNYKTKEDSYIKGIKNKIKAVVIMFSISITLILSGLIALGVSIKINKDNYNNMVAIAEQSGRSEDYENVLNSNALSDVSVYLGYIDSLKVDGVFTKEEEKNLLRYINTNIDSIKKKDNYGELAFNLGKLYWFYYENSTDNEGILLSVKWFKDAIDYKYNVEVSTVYYNLGMFNKDILSSIAEGDDVGMYKEYWGNLMSAKNIDGGELLDISTNLYIAKSIETYGYRLKSDGVTYEEVINEINDLDSYCNAFSPTSEVSQERYNELVEILKDLRNKVNLVYEER